MIALRITGFSGIVPRRGARLLDQNQAQSAVNCHLTSGYIGTLKAPKLVYTPGILGIKSVFRMTDGIQDFFLAWNRDVDAVKGQIAGDITYRTYFTGDGEPRVTNIALATASAPYPAGWYKLGVTPPITAPGASGAGGASGTLVSRAFVYTFVTPWGEESQPSPASAIVTVKIDDTWTINAMDVAPLNAMTVTGATWAAGVATIAMASTFGLRVGDEINVTGVNPAGYNGSKLPITALDATHVSYLVTVNPGAFVSNGALARVAPHNSTGMTKRIYWTETLADGTHFRLVKEVAESVVSTTIVNNTTISTAELVSLLWVQPPTDMKGIRMMPNGITVGFHGNEVCFSPAYIPYAYPVAYRLTTDFDIVAIEVVGNMVVIGTKGIPYTATGIDPSNMSQAKVEQPWPCVQKRSMVNVGQGVAFAVPQGLALVGPGIQALITQDLYTLEEWKLVNPSSFNASQYAGRYVAAFDAAGGARQLLIFDKAEFASEVQANSNVTVVYGDATTGKLYVVISDTIQEWDADSGQRMISDWFSREFVFPKPINLGAGKVDADFTMSAADIAAAQGAHDAQTALNAALIAANTTKGSVNSHSLNTRSVNGSLVVMPPPVIWDSLTFSLYVDGALKFSRSIVDANAFRLPAGYKKDNAAFRVSGNIIVKAIVVAETMKGLASA